MPRSHEVKMDAWQRFVRQVEEAKAGLGFAGQEGCFYRGHRDRSWRLQPTLLRHAERRRLTSHQLRSLEADLFFEFQARAREVHDRTLNDWDVLFMMRHHGLATRLLDWTETFAVALYFAIQGAEDGEEPCIWVLNPWALNAESWGIRDLVSPAYLGGKEERKHKEERKYSDIMITFDDFSFGWTQPIALYPIQRNPRLQAQRGYFTIHGDDIGPLEDINPAVVRRIDLPGDAVATAREFLVLAGIDEYLLFPDLDGLQRTLHLKHGIG